MRLSDKRPRLGVSPLGFGLSGGWIWRCFFLLGPALHQTLRFPSLDVSVRLRADVIYWRHMKSQRRKKL